MDYFPSRPIDDELSVVVAENNVIAMLKSSIDKFFFSSDKLLDNVELKKRMNTQHDLKRSQYFEEIVKFVQSFQPRHIVTFGLSTKVCLSLIVRCIVPL